MFDWIARNSETPRLLTSLLIAGVWLVYLRIFPKAYLRQRLPNILISLGAGACAGNWRNGSPAESPVRRARASAGPCQAGRALA
jgi:hypothetical protein